MEVLDQKNKSSKNVFYIGLLSFFGGISQDIFSPILPIYLTAVLGFGKTFVGTAEGIVTAASMIFAVVAGYFSDKYRKQKPIIFFGYFLSMLSRALLAFLTSSAAILGLRLADGIGKGVKDPPKNVLIAGSSEKNVRGKSFGIAGMLDTLGSVVGPLILFVLLKIFGDNNYRYILMFAAIPLLITLFVLITFVKEISFSSGNDDAQKDSSQDNHLTSKALEGKNRKFPKSFYIFLAIVIVFTLGNSSDSFLVLRAQGIGFSVEMLPVVIALFNLAYAASAIPFGMLSDKIGRIPTILIGWLIYVLTYAGFAYAFHPALIWLLYLFYGIYFGATHGVAKALLADLVGWENRGKAFGIYGVSVGIATFLASFIAGFLWDKLGSQVPFYFGSGMAALAALLLVSFGQKLKLKSENI
jgi:MFS family permease